MHTEQTPRPTSNYMHCDGILTQLVPFTYCPMAQFTSMGTQSPSGVSWRRLVRQVRHRPFLGSKLPQDGETGRQVELDNHSRVPHWIIFGVQVPLVRLKLLGSAQVRQIPVKGSKVPQFMLTLKQVPKWKYCLYVHVVLATQFPSTRLYPGIQRVHSPNTPS